MSVAEEHLADVVRDLTARHGVQPHSIACPRRLLCRSNRSFLKAADLAEAGFGWGLIPRAFRLAPSDSASPDPTW
jgi:hypothetical protein